MTAEPLTLPDTDHAEQWVRTRAADGLASARELAEGLRTDPPGDPLGVLEVWDQLSLELSNVASVGSLLSNVHPLEAVRDLAEHAEQDALRLQTELSLDRAIFDVFAGLDRTDLDAQAGRLLDKVLESFTAPASTATTRPGPGWGDQRAGDRDRPGVREEHPRRRPHHPGHPGPARRDAARTGSRPIPPTTMAWSP